ncbi:hypothetical protein BpHYR1_019486 [Brachionus plicatilis]|uniref:Uncharacterized protein n=1 Tax=Brachionus plicatilis TaxID=10195 RepID=A0A3M7RBS1_BRAPC|nr:hypothetical protein BpHYR1_019486 [Brachionus plicatilis]
MIEINHSVFFSAFFLSCMCSPLAAAAADDDDCNHQLQKYVHMNIALLKLLNFNIDLIKRKEIPSVEFLLMGFELRDMQVAQFRILTNGSIKFNIKRICYDRFLEGNQKLSPRTPNLLALIVLFIVYD